MTVKRNILTYLFPLLLILLSGAIYSPVSAQQFPVRVQVQCIPPFSPQLAGLYSGTQAKLIVTLINTDLQKPTLNVRLRFTIKGSNVSLRSRDYGYYPPVTLDAGLPVQLSLNDLAPYFNPDNLDVAGMSKAALQQNGQLPDGYYTICAEAVEINSGQLVSNEKQGCSPPAWLSVSEPPLLNLPRKGEAVAFREPLNIIFNWTPRHMSSPNAAFQTEYEFTLVEVWDNGVLPEAAFGTMPPLYQNTTSSTTLLYGPTEPPLLPGKQYAWRIQAKAKQGLDEYAVFRNNGYSEIFYFRLQEDCQPPEQVAATQENGRINITWAPQPKMFEYIVEYREQDKPNAEWFNVKSTSASATINDAIPGHKYEYRVGGYCSQGNKTLGDTHAFEVPKKDTANKNCGILPDISISNQTPIQQLQPDDQIMAGDFPVRLLKVQGSGSFTGSGYITIPFIGYNRVKVKFENIKVNTDRQLISGAIMTTFDSLKTQVVDVDSVIHVITDLASVINDLAHLTIDSDYLTVKELADKIREMAEEELPQELKDRIIKAADNLEQAKKEYDDAQAKKDAATTQEQRTEAQKKVDAAKEKFNNAKEEVKAVTAEKAALVKAVTDVLVTAIKELKDEARTSESSAITNFTTQQRQIKQAIFDNQGIGTDTTTMDVEDLGGYDEIRGETNIPESSRSFAQTLKDYDQKRKLLIGLKLIFALSDYYKDEQTLSKDFKEDASLNGKALIREIMDRKLKNTSKEDMIRYAKEQLKTNIDNLLK